MKLRTLDQDKLDAFVEYIEAKTNNPRFNGQQFRKYFSSKNDTLWLALEDNGEILSAAVVKDYPDGVAYLQEIQSVVKGYGKQMLAMLLARFSNIWWTVDPTAKPLEDLLAFYRQFDLNEKNLGKTQWSHGNDHYIFWKTDDEDAEMKILATSSKWTQEKDR